MRDREKDATQKSDGCEGKSERKRKGQGESKSRRHGTEEASTKAGPGNEAAAAVEADASGPWERGQETPLKGVPMEELPPGTSLVVTEANYFGAAVKVAGMVKKAEVTRQGRILHLKLTGTDAEAALKKHTGSPGILFRLHLCDENCDQQELGEDYIHAMKGRKLKVAGEQDRVTSFMGAAPGEEEDQLAELRRRSFNLEGNAEPGKAKDKKKKKKKKKDKKDKEKAVEKKPWLSGRHPLKASNKDPEDLFGGTGLDPQERIRKRVVKKAQR